MLGQVLGSLGIGITLWLPEQNNAEEPAPDVDALLQEDGLTNFVLQEDDSSLIILEG